MQQQKTHFFIFIISMILSSLCFANISFAEDAQATPAPNAQSDNSSVDPTITEPVLRPANVNKMKPIISSENITIISAYAKPSMAGSANSVAYISLHNANNTELVINGVTALSSSRPSATSIANRVEMHNIITDNKGVTKMVRVDKLVVPVNGDLIMGNGGVHIMLLDLKQALNEGDKIFVIIQIQGLGQYPVEVPVQNQ